MQYAKNYRKICYFVNNYLQTMTLCVHDLTFSVQKYVFD